MCIFFCRRKFNSQQSKVNILKVPARSPPQSAASEYIRTPEQQVIQPRYIIHLVFEFYAPCVSNVLLCVFSCLAQL